MKNSKFIALLRVLTQDEVVAFQKHLKHLQGDKITVRLFEYLRKFYPGFQDDKKLELAYVYRMIFNERLDADSRERKNMLNNLSKLHVWLKDFLLSERVRNDTWAKQALWLDILQSRGLSEEFSNEAIRFYVNSETEPNKNTQDCFKSMAANYFQFFNLTQNKRFTDVKALEQCMSGIAIYSETIRLKMACEVSNRTKLQPPSNTVDKTRKVKPLKIPKGKTIKIPQNDPLYLIYIEIAKLLEQDGSDGSQFDLIEKLLIKNVKNFDQLEMQTLYQYMQNYAAAQIRNDKEAIYAEKLHRLNQFRLAQHLLSQKNMIAPSMFNNMINVACTAQEYDWATTFIEKQSHLLPKDVQISTISLAKATVAFEKGAFIEVLPLLKDLDIKDTHEQIRLKSLVLRTYYELSVEFDSIFKYCLSFDAMLRRLPKPLSPPAEATLAFVLIVRAMLMENTDKPNLLKRIRETPNLYFRTWLRKKVDLLK